MTNGRDVLCQPYRVAYHGGRGDRVSDLDGPPADRADPGARHADPALVLLVRPRTVCRGVALAGLA